LSGWNGPKAEVRRRGYGPGPPPINLCELRLVDF
jgi:hypothetical protein